MTETLELGPVPTAEDCAQVGTENYHTLARIECAVYKNQLCRMFPKIEESGCVLTIKSNPHDFGTYFEVAIKYDEDNENQIEVAFEVENNQPEYWDEFAKRQLLELKEKELNRNK